MVLASASPRRRDLLTQLGYQPTQSPVDIDESARKSEEPFAYVERMAKEKLEAAFNLLAPNAGELIENSEDASLIVLAGDTICVKGSEILVKPSDYKDFERMMRLMSGSVHTVASSFALGEIKNGVCRVLNLEVVKTDVYFRSILEQELHAYWETKEPWDKAGGYGIQGLGAVFVERIEGSYSNVVGLPLMEVHQALKLAGVVSKL